MDSEQGTILAAFPSGFPVEAQAIALKSYRLIPANSLENQYTLEYLSRLTAADNSRMFKAYLRDAGFSLTGSTDQTNQTFLYATKDRNDLSIVIVKQNDQVRVTASYLIR